MNLTVTLARVEMMLEALLKHHGVEVPAPLASPNGDRGSGAGEPLPKAMGPKDMARAFSISEGTFYRLQRAGEYRRFELPRRIGPRGKRYSGEKVEVFLRGRR
jgi:hypothetical protein